MKKKNDSHSLTLRKNTHLFGNETIVNKENCSRNKKIINCEKMSHGLPCVNAVTTNSFVWVMIVNDLLGLGLL